MKFTTGYINFSDDILFSDACEADNWKEALIKNVAFYKYTDEDKQLTLEYLPDDLEEAKEEAFNQDWMFDVREIKIL